MIRKFALLVSLAIVVASTVFAQSSTNSESYLPLKKGNTWLYQVAGVSDLQIKTKIEEANLPIATHEYYKMTTSYGRKTMEKFVRAEEKAVYAIDKRTHVESKVFPKQIETGQSWETSDRNWRYEIIHLSDTLKTPHAGYKDLLHIRADLFEETEWDKPGIYDFYYQKGVGLIAYKRNGELRDYLIESKLK